MTALRSGTKKDPNKKEVENQNLQTNQTIDIMELLKIKKKRHFKQCKN